MDHQFVDRSNDRRYFTLTPRIVWALARNCYDYTLWGVIKDIAGEGGQCWLDMEELATLAMMSEGQVADSRNYLLEAGLLTGGLEAKPGKRHRVWVLNVPDLWPANVQWAQENLPLSARMDYKTALKQTKRPAHRVNPTTGNLSMAHTVSHTDMAHTVSHTEGYGSYGEPNTPAIEEPLKEDSTRKKTPTLQEKVGTDGMILAGTGTDAVEVFYESHSFYEVPLSVAKKRSMRQAITDLARWRKVCEGFAKTTYRQDNWEMMEAWYNGEIYTNAHWLQWRNGKRTKAETPAATTKTYRRQVKV